MASGLPDYYRGIDITYQTLGQVINRPKYGAALSLATAAVVLANTKTTLATILGKGMIYGGVLFCFNGGGQALAEPILEIDTNEFYPVNLSNLSGYNMVVERCNPFYILRYDAVTNIYSVGISHGYTFETGFKMIFEEKDGRTPAVSTRVAYALV